MASCLLEALLCDFLADFSCRSVGLLPGVNELCSPFSSPKVPLSLLFLIVKYLQAYLNLPSPLALDSGLDSSLTRPLKLAPPRSSTYLFVAENQEALFSYHLNLCRAFGLINPLCSF